MLSWMHAVDISTVCLEILQLQGFYLKGGRSSADIGENHCLGVLFARLNIVEGDR